MERNEVEKLIEKAKGRIVHLRHAAMNDGRLVLHAGHEIIHVWMSAEWAAEEQAEAARVCAYINDELIGNLDGEAQRERIRRATEAAVGLIP
jgi:hypothetical protein